ncbi:phospholipid phosphatase [Enterovibrio norvegicus FF-33]|uniref:undecaprenyl-diphosphate phosphatase n=1 Tax=Enterovibrio norvegicus FF-454 TaxID=1185651 RepID=A0A1E5BYR3_9GAMM|nr:phosphatase PAP2 family protein [Enterovibrio norvegicus]OEE58383.1 phospholipid phosphatase [Enterovibrio norvegicus FF-454]OEE70314.1 phospholipid phosphatase [Enterovibrio norvegicus FF-33]
MHHYLFVALLSLLTLSTSFAQETDETIKGAACLVSDDQGRVLVTRDILNNRIAIPGGYVDSDNPADAAIRETLEETGIDVEAVGEIARMGKAVLFDCRATSPIPVLKTTAEAEKAAVAAWQAEHFAREVRSVFLMKPNQEMLDNARFPEQVEMFPALLKRATPSPIQEFDDFSALASPFDVWNAGINQRFQNAIHALPKPIAKTMATLLDYASALGSGVLFFVLIPIAMATGGLKRVAEVLLVTILVTVVVSFGKLFFGVPRPFYVFPELQLGAASGFAFPSGHTATAFAVWGLVSTWINRARKTTRVIWLVPAVLVALSRVYLGVHYVTDVIAGAVIGVLVVLVAQHLARRLLSVRLWFGLGAIIIPFALTQIQPTFLYCAAFSFTFSAVLCLARHQQEHLTAPMGIKGFLMTLAGMLALAAIILGVGQISNSSIEILASYTLSTALLAIWLGWAVPKWGAIQGK